MAVDSLSRRSDLSASFSALKRIRPRVPFWQLAAHRIPTLWSLYRGLLRAAPHEHIQWRIRSLFRLRRGWTSPLQTREQLLMGHRWLAVFERAAHGDKQANAVMDRYNRMIAAKREREEWKSIFHEELLWMDKMRNRPIVTGSLLRPSLFNRPLPRLKPQPIHVSRMIWNRRRVRALRLEKQELWSSWRDDLIHESRFEAGLSQKVQKVGMRFEGIFGDLRDWTEPINQLLENINTSYALDKARAQTPYSPQLLSMVKEARREKIRNKTRERERERRGEILRSTVNRMNKGPPAHVLSKMSEEERRKDRILRGPGEAGYTGRLKREAGMKLKDDHSWRREDGEPCEQEELDKREVALRRAQEQRRRYFHSIDSMPSFSESSD